MIVDFHTHAFPDALAPRAIGSLVEKSGGMFPPCTDGTVQGLKNNMRAFGVDISVVQPVITKASQLKTLNEWAKSIEGDGLLSFGGVYPHTDDYKRDIDFVCSLGFKGIKMHAEYQNFLVDDPQMLKIYDYAFSQGLIVLHHAGFDPAFPPPFRSSPERFARVAKEMRGGVLVVAHLGGQQQWDEVEKHLVGTGVYLDTSMGTPYYPMEQFVRIVKNHGADKILFGSDSPWSKADEEISAIENTSLTREEKDLIFYKNAQRLLGL